MKRKALLRILAKAGFSFKEDGPHTKVLKNGKYITTVPRHCEIPEQTVKNILTMAGLNNK